MDRGDGTAERMDTGGAGSASRVLALAILLVGRTTGCLAPATPTDWSRP